MGVRIRWCQIGDACQRQGNILNGIILIGNPRLDIFDLWGSDFMGPFPSLGNKYISRAVDYFKWCSESAPHNDAGFTHRLSLPYQSSERVVSIEVTNRGLKRNFGEDRSENRAINGRDKLDDHYGLLEPAYKTPNG
ncbi:hypothetical protein Tco_0791697 [Tanacetum coccineum]